MLGGQVTKRLEAGSKKSGTRYFLSACIASVTPTPSTCASSQRPWSMGVPMYDEVHALEKADDLVAVREMIE